MRIYLLIALACVAGAFANSYAGPVSLRPDEIISLRELLKTNEAAAAAYAEVKHSADAALQAMPNPIERIFCEGDLDKDPLKKRTQASLPDLGKSWPDRLDIQ